MSEAVLETTAGVDEASFLPIKCLCFFRKIKVFRMLFPFVCRIFA